MGHDSAEASGRSAGRPTEITDEAVFDRVVDAENRVLVDFYADWCAPCQMMESTLEDLATETEASVVKVNVEEHPVIAYRYDVESIPTFVGIQGGEVEGRLVGVQEKHDIEQLLE